MTTASSIIIALITTLVLGAVSYGADAKHKSILAAGKHESAFEAISTVAMVLTAYSVLVLVAVVF